MTATTPTANLHAPLYDALVRSRVCFDQRVVRHNQFRRAERKLIWLSCLRMVLLVLNSLRDDQRVEERVNGG